MVAPPRLHACLASLHCRLALAVPWAFRTVLSIFWVQVCGSLCLRAALCGLVRPVHSKLLTMSPVSPVLAWDFYRTVPEPRVVTSARFWCHFNTLLYVFSRPLGLPEEAILFPAPPGPRMLLSVLISIHDAVLSLHRFFTSSSPPCFCLLCPRSSEYFELQLAK